MSSMGFEGLGRDSRRIYCGITQVIFRLDMAASHPDAVLDEHGPVNALGESTGGALSKSWNGVLRPYCANRSSASRVTL